MELNTTIYKVDSKGKIREWTIDVIDKGTHAEIHTFAGLRDGKLIPTIVPVYNGKNIGKSNETTYYTQAVSDALNKMKKQLEGEYRFDVNDAAKGELKGGKKPMLAEKLIIAGDGKTEGKTIQKMGIEFDVVGVEPKLNGLRCTITANESEVKLRTRTSKPFAPIPHIEKDIRQAYLEHNLSGTHEFDGELYTREIPFEQISGALRGIKKTPQQLHDLQFVKFHIYDICTDEGYSERYKQIIELFGTNTEPNYSNIHPIEYHEIVATDENITAMMNDFINRGNEGLMLRRLDIPYEHKRTWQLCKYKFFEEEEYEFFDVLEDSRGGMAGMIVLKCEPYVDRDGKTKDTFKAGLKDVSHEQATELFINKNDYIGKQVTIQFQEYSKYGVPVFPKFKGVRIDAE